MSTMTIETTSTHPLKFGIGDRVRTLPGSQHNDHFAVANCSHCSLDEVVTGEHHFTGTVTATSATHPHIYPPSQYPDWYRVRLDCGNVLGVQEGCMERWPHPPMAGAWDIKRDGVYNWERAVLLFALRANVLGRKTYGEHWFANLFQTCPPGPMRDALTAIDDPVKLAETWQMSLLIRGMIVTCFESNNEVIVALSNVPNLRFTIHEARAELLNMIELPKTTSLRDFLEARRSRVVGSTRRGES
jgi:hypothetical protein